MFENKLSADDLVAKLLCISKTEPVYILDSCGVGHLGSHLLIAALRPVEIVDASHANPEETLRILDDKLSQNMAAIFTLSYDFGAKLQPVSVGTKEASRTEADAFIALFNFLIIHDYDSGSTRVVGNDRESCDAVELIGTQSPDVESFEMAAGQTAPVTSNFTRPEYIAAVERIREHIRNGDTYQTNLTQQLRCQLSPDTTPEALYWRLRRDHPAPFSAFLKRPHSTVVSASPERFFRVARNRDIEASPIKGTSRRGKSVEEDMRLRSELLSSAKDRAENTMIVDLVRNDIGRVCEFGSVVVEKLCDIEEHPTLFHLVSTVRGKLRDGITFSKILRAVFPCGSITGTPKIRTMQLIDEIENSSRGLSMGAIGFYFPERWDLGDSTLNAVFDLSVAIRTMVVRDGEAVFNVGGGVVIDSDPEKEFDESMLKAQSLLNAIGAPSVAK
ncbi:MAG: aminodeoxychorismate synthase component I [Acidobacteriota bacterium]